jgi:pimeloyl-ACP methyl ester carboxylesterase
MKPRHFSVTIDGQSLELVASVRDAGKDLLFFVHGLGCSKDTFHHFWDHTDFEDYSALALDLVGFG